jgi:predicted phosphodiesterase
MKIAVLSDIHSNVFALEAVVDDATKRGVERMLNLGDIFYGPIAPKATYELLKEHDFITIRGNQDRQIYEALPEEIDANPTMQFVLNDLGEEPVLWMKSLPFDNQLNNEIYMCHGSPTDDLKYLLENIETGFPCLRSDREIMDSLNGQSSNIILCGHTHIPRTVKLTSGQLVINPGSVGLPAYTDDEPIIHSMENYCPHASYAVIEKNKAGWTIQLIKVPYDYPKAVKMAKEQQRQNWGHFLNTGRGYNKTN